MNRLKFLLGLGFIAALSMQADFLSAQAKPKIKPNVVIIVADDLGFMDLQCYGAEKVKTPNIDRLAKDGMKFTNFYSMPSSSPSYAAIMTGCYPKRVGILADLTPNSSVGLSTKEMTIAKMVKQNNYATCMIGKWHLGDDSTFLPTKQGFDEFFGIPYAKDMCKQVDPKYGDMPLIEGTKVIETNPDQAQLTKRYADKAIDFITRNSGSQFLLCMGLTNTHVPLYSTKEFSGKSKGGKYYDAVAETDWVVGQITKTLQKLGIDKTTIIIFTSTNGPNVVYGNHAGYAGGYKEGVNTVFEGGIRVPFIFCYPDRAPGGQVTNEIGSLIDILPTLADLTRTAPPTVKIDGIDLWPVLSGMERLLRARKGYYCCYLGDQLTAIRQGDWKFYLSHSYPAADPGKDGKPGKLQIKQTEMELYNIAEDPSETNNVYGENRPLTTKLKALMEPFDKELEQNKRSAGKVDK